MYTLFLFFIVIAVFRYFWSL